MSNQMVQYSNHEQFRYFNVLHKYFSDETHASIFINIINGTSMITLRQIEYFLKIYSKKHGVIYLLPHPLPEQPPQQIHIHEQYTNACNLFSTKTFDIFCRHIHIRMPVGSQVVETNLAQLNMFHWIMENGVIDYMETNHADIINDMYEVSTSRKKSTLSSENKKMRGPKTSKRPRITGRIITPISFHSSHTPSPYVPSLTPPCSKSVDQSVLDILEIKEIVLDIVDKAISSALQKTADTEYELCLNNSVCVC